MLLQLDFTRRLLLREAYSRFYSMGVE